MFNENIIIINTYIIIRKSLGIYFANDIIYFVNDNLVIELVN